LSRGVRRRFLAEPGRGQDQHEENDQEGNQGSAMKVWHGATAYPSPEIGASGRRE
jgi:hypothetical protein